MIPEAFKRDADGGMCDFCSSSNPAWIYPSGNFVMPEAAWGSAGAWAACDACSERIEADDTEGLLDRVPTLAALRTGPTWLTKAEVNYVRDEARKLHDEFRRLRKGPRRAFG